MPIRYPSTWIVTVYRALTRLADNPWALFVFLAAIHSVAKPYVGIWHDARLYSGQVLNQVETGAYADDLFFRYGSQDNYSLFSRIAAPMVKLVGLETAFFLIFLASKSLLIFGMIRIVQTLIPNRAAGVLALGYCMVASIRYGGHSILNVQEAFLTPRTLACGLVLLGLDFMLRHRPVLSLGMIVLAAGVHPLMAFGGLLIWAGYQIWTVAGAWPLLGSSAVAASLAAIPICVESIGRRCFGEMDEVWREAIVHASGFNFPSQWTTGDWSYLAFQLGLLGIAIVQSWRVDASKTRFMIVLGIVTIMGTIGTALAEQLPFALPLQGQPYRALWILAVLHYALAFSFIVEWSRSRSGLMQALGCLVLGYACWIDQLPLEMMLPLFAFPLFVIVLRGLDPEPRDRSWLVHAVQLSLIVGAVGWSVYKLAILTSGLETLRRQHPDWHGIVEVYLLRIGPIAFMLVAAVLLLRWGVTAAAPVRIGLAAVGVIGLQLLCFVIPVTETYRANCSRYRTDLAKLRGVIHESRAPGTPLPTVYCDLGCLDYVWLDLKAKCYFEWWQAGGYMFRREMAMEGRRRSKLVAPFAIERYRTVSFQIDDGDKEAIGRMFQANFDDAKPNREALAHLCREPGLDYVLLGHHFDGLVHANMGELYLYKCADVRVALGLTVTDTATAVAASR